MCVVEEYFKQAEAEFGFEMFLKLAFPVRARDLK